MIVAIMALILISVGLVVYAALPLLANKTTALTQKRTQKFVRKMERVVMKSDIQKLSRLYILAPAFFGAAGYIFFPAEMRLVGVIIGSVFGFLGPSLYIKILIKKRANKFNQQLVDALMIMSSSFRGGLSLVQAMEAVVEEMPDPVNQEFGTVLNENKMGVSLEEALNHLYGRLPSPALQQVMTAILLARETGGNLPVIFSRIVNSIREHNKIQQNIDTLTLQGKIQGAVMSLLPFGFAMVVYSTNRQFFNNMFTSEMGRLLLVYAAVSEVIGVYLIYKISSFKEF